MIPNNKLREDTMSKLKIFTEQPIPMTLKPVTIELKNSLWQLPKLQPKTEKVRKLL